MPKLHLLYQLTMMSALDVLPHVVRNQSLAIRARNRLQRHALSAASVIARQFNGALYQDTPDRLVLETRILPYYQLQNDVQRIVFVGCDWYTEGYARLFAHKEFWTIDSDASRAVYGASRHQVAPMRNMRGLLDGADLVICNGVIGWGLDDAEDAEQSFAAAYDVMRPGADLIVGVNDRAPHKPFDLRDIVALQRFEPFTFEPLGTSEYRVDHELCHVFRFYRKPEG